MRSGASVKEACQPVSRAQSSRTWSKKDACLPFPPLKLSVHKAENPRLRAIPFERRIATVARERRTLNVKWMIAVALSFLLVVAFVSFARRDEPSPTPKRMIGDETATRAPASLASVRESLEQDRSSPSPRRMGSC